MTRPMVILLVMLLATACYRRPQRAAAPTPPRKQHVVLTGKACSSQAAAISIDTKPTALTELLSLFGRMSGMQITSDLDLTLVTAEAHVADVPWDCLVEDAARQLGLKLVVDGTQVRLALPRSR